MEDKGRSMAMGIIDRVTPHRGRLDLRDYIGSTENYHVWAWDGHGSEFARVYICVPIDGDESKETVVNVAGPTIAQARQGVYEEVISLLKEKIEAFQHMNVLD